MAKGPYYKCGHPTGRNEICDTYECWDCCERTRDRNIAAARALWQPRIERLRNELNELKEQRREMVYQHDVDRIGGLCTNKEKDFRTAIEALRLAKVEASAEYNAHWGVGGTEWPADPIQVRV